MEFPGALLWLLLAGFAVWQILLATWTFNQASNAARTASRVDGRGGDAEKAGTNALSRRAARARGRPMAGEKATVKVRIPLVVPGARQRRASRPPATRRCPG